MLRRIIPLAADGLCAVVPTGIFMASVELISNLTDGVSVPTPTFPPKLFIEIFLYVPEESAD